MIRGFELETGAGCAHICSGMGASRVSEAMEVLLRVYRPRLLILLGFSVGVTDSVSVGDLIVDSRSDPGLLELIRSRDPSTRISPVGKCDFLLTSKAKVAWGEDNKTRLVADLESEEFLSALNSRAAGLVVRSVSDDAHTDLPLDFSKFTNAQGFPDQKALAKTLAKQPSLLPKMFRLAGDAKRATESLEQFFEWFKPLAAEYLAAMEGE